MNLKEHLEKFDQSLLEEKQLDKIVSSKKAGMLQEHIARFDEALGDSSTIKSTSDQLKERN